MNRYTVAIRGEAWPRDVGRAIAQSLMTLGAIVVLCESHTDLTVAVDAEDASLAVVAAEARLAPILAVLDRPWDHSVRSILLDDDLEWILEAAASELVGLAEISEMLSVTRQRASQLSREDAFPDPIGVLAGRTVWGRKQVDEFREERWNSRPRRAKELRSA